MTRMKIERAVKIITALLPLEQNEVLEAWSVVADQIAERGQYPPYPGENRRDGTLDLETYKAKVQIGETGPVKDLWDKQQAEREAAKLVRASSLTSI